MQVPQTVFGGICASHSHGRLGLKVFRDVATLNFVLARCRAVLMRPHAGYSYLLVHKRAEVPIRDVTVECNLQLWIGHAAPQQQTRDA